MRRTALALMLAAGAVACASVPDRPEPIPDPPSPPPAASGPADGAGGTIGAGGLPARRYPRPPRPWMEPEVRLSPAEPRAGTAAGITISTRCFAREPRGVSGSFGDQSVSFGELGGRWFGMMALPPEESGPRELRLRYRLSPDSAVTAARRVVVGDRTYPADRLSVEPRYSDPPASVRERIERERRLVSDLLSRDTPRWLLTDDIRWPRPPRITSPYGERRIFNEAVRSRHWGVDLRGRPGAPVRAAARGRVALVRHLYFAGRAVYLDHGHGVFTGYFHLSGARVREGETVEPGQVIGEVGASGRVTGPHLHWSLYVQGIHVDARSLFSVEVPASGDDDEAASGRTACSLPVLEQRSSLPRRTPHRP